MLVSTSTLAEYGRRKTEVELRGSTELRQTPRWRLPISFANEPVLRLRAPCPLEVRLAEEITKASQKSWPVGSALATASAGALAGRVARALLGAGAHISRVAAVGVLGTRHALAAGALNVGIVVVRVLATAELRLVHVACTAFYATLLPDGKGVGAVGRAFFAATLFQRRSWSAPGHSLLSRIPFETQIALLNSFPSVKII